MADHVRGDITSFLEALAIWLAEQTGLVYGGGGDASGNLYLHGLPDDDDGQDNISSIKCTPTGTTGWSITDRVRLTIQSRGKPYDNDSAFGISNMIYGAFIDADTKTVLRKIDLTGDGGGGGGWIMMDLGLMRPQFTYEDSKYRPIVTINLDVTIGL